MDPVPRCPACDAPRRIDATFCTNCGTPLAPIVPLSGAPMPPARRSTNPLVIGAVVVAVALVASGLVLLLTSSGRGSESSDRESEGRATVHTSDRANDDGDSPAVRTAPTLAVSPPIAATLVVAPTTSTTTTTTTTSSTTTTTSTTTLPPSTVAAATIAPEIEVVPGDLGVTGVAMSRPACDGRYIVMVGSALNPDSYPSDVAAQLAKYPGSSYLRTDQTCPSLRPDYNGSPIYSIYYGVYDTAQAACADRWRGPSDAYVKVLSTTVAWNTPITC